MFGPNSRVAALGKMADGGVFQGSDGRWRRASNFESLPYANKDPNSGERVVGANAPATAFAAAPSCAYSANAPAQAPVSSRRIAGALRTALLPLRLAAQNKKLDLTDAFSVSVFGLGPAFALAWHTRSLNPLRAIGIRRNGA